MAPPPSTISVPRAGPPDALAAGAAVTRTHGMKANGSIRAPWRGRRVGRAGGYRHFRRRTRGTAGTQAGSGRVGPGWAGLGRVGPGWAGLALYRPGAQTPA